MKTVIVTFTEVPGTKGVESTEQIMTTTQAIKHIKKCWKNDIGVNTYPMKVKQEEVKKLMTQLW